MRMILLAAFLGSSLLAQGFAPPKPTSHHLAMQRQVGTWDAVVKVQGPPGGPYSGADFPNPWMEHISSYSHC